MTSESKSKGFNLFEAEDQVLARAKDLAARVEQVPAGLQDDILALVESYNLVLKEQRRLVRLSDRQQSQVAKLNKELATRTAQAEDALAKLKAVQESLVQAEKLASLGALVGGVAHEINTPVGIALSCASHLSDTTRHLKTLYEADDVGIEDFEAFLTQATDATTLVVDNCKRAAQLIGSFKQVAVDRVSAERRLFNLEKTIDETVTSLSPQIKGAGHRVEVRCPSDIMIDGYPGVLSQILGNFIMNSLIHGFDGCARQGVIAIKVDRVSLNSIILTYDDNGKGIPDANLSRVFDPFFTTKMGQGGSGLGLNIVYNLVTGPLGGTIAVTSAEDQGTQFKISFPPVAPI